MKYSVALATYNGAKYVAEQIASISSQSVKVHEVVVSDDCSSDHTVAEVRRALSGFPGLVRVIENKCNVGFTANFQRALERCSGDVIFICDQDDIWAADKVSVLAGQLESSRAHVAIGDAEIVRSDGERTGVTRLRNVRAGRYDAQHYVQGACTALTREFLRDVVLPIPSGWAYDSWIHTLAQALEARVVVPVVVQYFRRHSSNATASPTSADSPPSRTRRLFEARKRFRREARGKRSEYVKESRDRWAALLARLEEIRRADEGREAALNWLVPDDQLQDLHLKVQVFDRRLTYLRHSRSRRIGRVILACRHLRSGAVSPYELLADALVK